MKSVEPDDWGMESSHNRRLHYPPKDHHSQPVHFFYDQNPVYPFLLFSGFDHSPMTQRHQPWIATFRLLAPFTLNQPASGFHSAPLQSQQISLAKVRLISWADH